MEKSRVRIEYTRSIDDVGTESEMSAAESASVGFMAISENIANAIDRCDVPRPVAVLAEAVETLIDNNSHWKVLSVNDEALLAAVRRYRHWWVKHDILMNDEKFDIEERMRRVRILEENPESLVEADLAKPGWIENLFPTTKEE